MANADTLVAKLDDIGDAIRAKTGGTAKLTLDEMPDEIASISGGGGDVAGIIAGTATEIDGPLTAVRPYAFHNYAALESIDLSGVTEVPNNAFEGCSALETIGDAALEVVGLAAFRGCSALSNVDMSALVSIAGSAFRDCSSISGDLVLSAGMTVAGNSTFSGTGITSVSGDATFSFGNSDTSTFASCSALVSVDLPTVTMLTISMFYQCTSLREVNLPNATSGASNGSHFSGCTSLEKLSLPKLANLGVAPFNGCTSLTEVSLPALTSLNYQAFNGAPSGLAVLLPGETVPTVSSNFPATMPAYFYVKDELVDTYKAAARWTVIKERIFPLSEYQPA